MPGEQRLLRVKPGQGDEQRIAKRVIVDGDACPRKVKAITAQVAERYGWEMIIIASFKHNIEEDCRRVTVGDEPQAADFAVINMAQKGDIVVTQDWGLAAVVLEKGAGALSPHGTVYRRERIGFLLEERHLKAAFRRAGGRTRGPSARTGVDDERFKKALERLIKELDY